MKIIDIRQSHAWSEYLKLYGWKSIELSNSNYIRVNSFLFTNRASIQFPSGFDVQELEEISAVCKQHKVLFLKISPADECNGILLKEQGYRQTKQIEIAPNTVRIDLAMPEMSLWETFSSNCRYSVRKAVKDGHRVEFIQLPSQKDLQMCREVLEFRGKKMGFYVPSIKDLTKKVLAFGSEAFVCNIYNHNNQLTGSKFFLGYNGGIWGLHSGTSAVGQKSTAGYMLLWECMKYFKSLGYSFMDIGGISDLRLKHFFKQWNNYSSFKKEFNGELYTFDLPYIKYFGVFANSLAKIPV